MTGMRKKGCPKKLFKIIQSKVTRQVRDLVFELNESWINIRSLGTGNLSYHLISDKVKESGDLPINQESIEYLTNLLKGTVSNSSVKDKLSNSPMKKKVKLDLTEVDGNAYFLMSAFADAAKSQGWLEEEIEKVITEAKSSDYDHLVATLQSNCK